MTGAVETLVLTRSDIERCLSPAACREAIAYAFALLAAGRVPGPLALGFETPGGGFHVKAALFAAERPRFVAKVNGNFPGNPAARGLPTIQGVLVLADASDGRPLAVMDSASLTAIRTAAASMVAAERLMRTDASVAAIIGCGLQGAAHVDALLALRPFREVRLFDTDRGRAEQLATGIETRAASGTAREAAGLAGGTAVVSRVAGSPREAALGAHVIVTCTTGGAFVLGAGDVTPGAFVAAVGADHANKREIDPSLLMRSQVVVDDLAQCAASGDLRSAIEAGVMTECGVYAELAAVVAGTRAGRLRDDETFVFDSTGIALEDAAAADVAFERALALGLGQRVRFAA